ncbi:MAG: hypothetical protein ACLFPH_11185 [Bacteroidales bacterium]
MKKIIILLGFISFSLFCFSQNKDKIWDFPVKPGTDAWASLTSTQEMIDTCQIPVEILSKLTTAELAELCLNYPLLGDMLVTNDFQKGFEAMSSFFNGFQELKKRNDAGVTLLKLYTDFNLHSLQEKKGKEITNVFLDMCIDVIMAQPVFLQQFNKEQEDELMEASLNRLKRRQQIGDSHYRQKTTAVILSRLLVKKEGIEQFDKLGKDRLLLLNNHFILKDTTIIDAIKRKSEKYLHQ